MVLCCGILYHLTDHLRLLTAVAELGPKAIILDTNVSRFEGAVVELRSPLGDSPPRLGQHLEGYPTRAALDAMISSLGWTVEYYDWHGSGLLEQPHTGDYRTESRVSARITCPDHAVPAADRERGVAAVLASGHPRDREFIALSMVAKSVGMSPQALRIWVNKARRERDRKRDFTL